MAEDNNATSTSSDDIAFFLRQLVDGIIAAFHINIRRGNGEQASGARIIKNANGIDRLQRGDDERAVVLRVDRATFAFEFAHGAVAVQKHQQGIGLSTRGSEIIDMASMKQIETAIGHGKFFAITTKPFAPDLERIGNKQLGSKIHAPQNDSAKHVRQHQPHANSFGE